MKILFITKGDLPDYQADTIMHGGRSVLGADFVDANFCWYMYQKEKNEFWNTRIPNGGNSYGRGMTLHGTLPECNVDRTDIESKIRSKFFDYVIYGSGTRCIDYLSIVTNVYPKEKIIFIDGEDDQQIRDNLLSVGVLFKRELVGDNALPINFGIPKEKVIEYIPIKCQDWATIIPGRMDTYIFYDEKSYYNDYRKSYFGLTHKKGGWDCARHYEILMNGCVPYFPDISNCPKNTMTSFPKELCKIANGIVESKELNEDQYQELVGKFLNYTKERLTTESVFNKMVSFL